MRSGELAPDPGAGPPQALLQIEELSRHFGEKVALDQISLTIEAGEFFTIIGPSGSGKTTLLRILGGFDSPDKCRKFELAGVSMVGVPAHRRNVATVFQHYALFPHMSVGKNVEYGLKVRGLTSEERRARASEALRTVQLDDMYDRSIATLSGGERQRVAVARAIVVQPALLLLDEPLGALDEKLRNEMQFELKQLQESIGITFIYVTHNQDEALTMSDRMAVLHNGLLEQLATPEEVYSRPRTKFVADFMGAANFLRGELQRVDDRIAEVRYRDLTFRGQIPEGFGGSFGDSVWIAARPEYVHLSSDKLSSGPGVLSATVQRCAYRGSYLEAIVALKDGTTIVARLSDRAKTPERGSVVSLAFDPDYTMILSE